ncbi:LytTR family transcriptional regulator [Oleomonas cavernae]|uniref:LytTR family transcriptional regulator n=1 Tax=Oleomonas cavernae TaxID=2320859 RepID=A0A418W8L6_9PROT|nr:LytTR family transcriptional regulator [Oleomonas cavernae]
MPHDIMAIVVAIVSFLISGGFLLSLTPDRQLDREQPAPSPVASSASAGEEKSLPPEAAFARQVEVQKDNRNHRLAVSSIAFVRANGHYTLVSDGEQESFCQSTIGEIEALLDPALFMRVHRSYIVSISRIEAVRRAGDGGIAEIDAQVSHIWSLMARPQTRPAGHIQQSAWALPAPPTMILHWAHRGTTAAGRAAALELRRCSGLLQPVLSSSSRRQLDGFHPALPPGCRGLDRVGGPDRGGAVVPESVDPPIDAIPPGGCVRRRVRRPRADDKGPRQPDLRSAPYATLPCASRLGGGG